MDAQTLTAETDYDLGEELRRRRLDGSLIRHKARLVTEVLLERLAAEAAAQGVSIPDLVAATKLSADISGVLAKNAPPPQAGTHFSVLLQVPEMRMPPARVIDVSPAEVGKIELPVPARETPEAFQDIATEDAA